MKTFLCLSLVFEIVAKFVRSRWLDISLVVFYAVIYGPRRILKIFDPSTPVVWGGGGGKESNVGGFEKTRIHRTTSAFYILLFYLVKTITVSTRLLIERAK